MTETRWRIKYLPLNSQYVGSRNLVFFYGDTIGDVMDMIHETEPTA